jgi:carbamoyl-phosphate synthase large subunit
MSAHDDSYLRKTAIKHKIPYLTTMAAGSAAAQGIKYMREHTINPIHSLQEWHEQIKEKKGL